MTYLDVAAQLKNGQHMGMEHGGLTGGEVDGVARFDSFQARRRVECGDGKEPHQQRRSRR
jgi:hypothetical protein